MTALDSDGNAFSLLGVRTLRFDWSFSPLGSLVLLVPRSIRQHHEESLRQLSDAEAKRYFTVPVRAQLLPTIATARVRLLNSSRGVATEEPIHILNSSLLIFPATLVVMAPGMGLQYRLHYCPETDGCTGAGEPPPQAITLWSTHPPSIASVNASGFVDALVVGGTMVRARVLMQSVEADLAVALPHAIELALLSECTGDRQKACAAWAKAGECDCNPAFMREHCSRTCCGERLGLTLVVGEKRIVRRRCLTRAAAHTRTPVGGRLTRSASPAHAGEALA